MFGLQLPPFLDLLGVVLQMGAHDVLHEAREVGAPIAQTTDNKVRALLCVSIQIDNPTFDQLQEISVEVRRSKTLVGEISVGVRRLKVPALGFIANLTRLPCALAAAFGVVNPQVLLGIHLETRVAFIPQW